MNKHDKIYVAGHRGLVGSALVRMLYKEGYDNIVYRDLDQLDLRDKTAVEIFFATEKPDCVFLAAARVGGIKANATMPAHFIYDNLLIQTNVLMAAARYGVQKVLFLGSSCIYPKYAAQPIKEDYLLQGLFEPTNRPYAVAKIAGIQLCRALHKSLQYHTKYIACMPTNMYGPRDNFHPEHSHVVPALIRKFVEAKRADASSVNIWGSGKVRREFLYVDDFAQAALFLMRNYEGDELLNVGVGEDITIAKLAHTIKEVSGFNGEIVFDSNQLEGTPRKLLDVSRINQLGWRAQTSLKKGLEYSIRWYEEHEC